MIHYTLWLAALFILVSLCASSVAAQDIEVPRLWQYTAPLITPEQRADEPGSKIGIPINA